MSAVTHENKLFGIMAEFDSPEALIAGAKAAHTAGYRKMDGHSPFPVEGLVEAMGSPRTRLPRIVFCFGLLGLFCGYGLQYYTAVIDYPINIGGRPLNSIPSFIPVSFEMTILFASLSAAFFMLILNGLPQPYHPVFNVAAFDKASKDGFFLCIESTDPQFDAVKTKAFLQGIAKGAVHEVHG